MYCLAKVVSMMDQGIHRATNPVSWSQKKDMMEYDTDGFLLGPNCKAFCGRPGESSLDTWDMDNDGVLERERFQKNQVTLYLYDRSCDTLFTGKNHDQGIGHDFSHMIKAQRYVLHILSRKVSWQHQGREIEKSRHDIDKKVWKCYEGR